MPFPALEIRPVGAPAARSRNKRYTPRGERILERIDMLGVTRPSVARRAGYAVDTIRTALWHTEPDAFLLECVEQALDLPKWKG